MSHRFRAPLWRHTGAAAWWFITVPIDIADEIEFRTAGQRRGFGSVRVDAHVGDTSWRTSIFPDRATSSYLLPVKKAVRLAEGLLDEGVIVEVELSVLEEML